MTGAADLEWNLMAARSLVSVVDDDESVRESLPELLRSFGFAVEAFASAEEFLMSEFLLKTDCLVLDIAMPGMSGIALRRELALRKVRIPIIFITAHADAEDPRLLETGTVACLLKPFSGDALVDAVNRALEPG